MGTKYMTLLSLHCRNSEALRSRSVTRYFARQLLNKLAKNYQNVEKITKFLLSAKSGLKSIKHLSKTKSVKRFLSLKLCFPCFSFSLVFLIAIVQNANMASQRSRLGPGP